MDGWIRYYPPDVFETLWTRIEDLIASDRLVSPDEVLRELEKKEGDSLHKWAKQQERLFRPIDAAVQKSTSEILTQFPRLVDSRKDRSTADPFVIALAQVSGFCVVTGEKSSGTPEKPRIPNVCEHYGVRCIGLLQLIRDMGWQFK